MVRPASYYVDDLFRRYNLKKGIELEKGLNYKAIDKEIKKLDRDKYTVMYAERAGLTKEAYTKREIEKKIEEGDPRFFYNTKGRKFFRGLLQFANKPRLYKEDYLDRTLDFAEDLEKIKDLPSHLRDEAKKLKEIGIGAKIAGLFDKYRIGPSRGAASHLRRDLYIAARRRQKVLTDILKEETLTIILLLAGVFFISMSKEGMYFTGNIIKEQSFVSMNGLGIGIILSIAALVVLFVKFLRKH